MFVTCPDTEHDLAFGVSRKELDLREIILSKMTVGAYSKLP